jgi:hypothetical protein
MRNVLLAVAAAAFAFSFVYAMAARAYPFGSSSSPGPGVYPFGVAILIFLTSIATALEAKRKTSEEKVEWEPGASLWRVLAILGAMILYGVALPYLGYIIASMWIIFAAMQVMGGLRWPLKIVLTLLITVGSYALFGMLLGVPLPAGIWFE